MIQLRLLLLSTFLFWLVVGGVVIRTNRLLLSPVTFEWNNLRQPNGTFRWSVVPATNHPVLLANSAYSFKISAPKKFSTGELRITTTGSGSVVVNINAPAGKPNNTASLAGAGNMILPLNWEAISVQTRTFNVDLLTGAQPVTIEAISLSLNS